MIFKQIRLYVVSVMSDGWTGWESSTQFVDGNIDSY